MTKLETTHQTITDQLAKGHASQIWWTFSGTALTTDELRAVVAAAGLDPDDVKDIDPVTALNKAVNEFSIIRKGRKVMEARVLKSQPNDTEVAIDLLVFEEKKKDGKLRSHGTPCDRLVWSKVNNDWFSKGMNDEACQKLMARVAHRQKYHDGNDVRSSVVMPALRLSKAFHIAKGQYMVVHEAAAPIAKAQKALKGVESFRLSVGTITPGMGWDEDLADGAEANVRSELEELQKQIDGWRDMASRVRSDTVCNVMDRFNMLRDRAMLYASSLSVTLNDVEDDINAMEALANEIIDGNRAAADKRDEEKIVAKGGMTKEQKQREAIAALPDAQLDALWAVYCPGQEKPEGREAMIAKLSEEYTKKMAA